MAFKVGICGAAGDGHILEYLLKWMKTEESNAKLRPKLCSKRACVVET